ncbi:MAG: adenylate kinase [Oscillospiraceae bacterium]|nr:adenylate kinase [Oscillospiraceae bacterium]
MRQDEGLRRIIVIGSSGSGKSTFARRLRDMTGLPLYYLDMIRHKPDRTTISSEEFDKRLGDILSEDRWIIDGNYQRTLEARLKKCDTVFLFDIPVEVCLAGAKARVGTKREDMPWTETELDEEFRQWIVDFPKKQLPEIYGLLEKYKDKNIVVFKSREEAEAYLKGELL